MNLQIGGWPGDPVPSSAGSQMEIDWVRVYQDNGGNSGNVCSVARQGSGVRITWQNKRGVEVLRNAGGWVVTPAEGTLSYYDPGGSLNEGWLIRRDGVDDEVCNIL